MNMIKNKNSSKKCMNIIRFLNIVEKFTKVLKTREKGVII